MSKRVFIFLLFMMSISLVGIIFIQSYFIIQNYENNNTQFTSNVNYVLNQSSSMAERVEFRRYVRKFRDLINSQSEVDTTSIKNLYIVNEDPINRETIVYKNGVIEENILIPQNRGYYDDFFNMITDKDNITITRLSNEREEKIYSSQKLDNNSLSPEEYLMKVGRISKSKEILFETAYNDLAKRNSIDERIGDLDKFENILISNFKKMNIDLDFQYAIFNKDSITNIKSLNFENPNSQYKSVIFKDENNLSDYTLRVAFPDKTPFLLSSVISLIITSVIFTSIIIIAYITTILLLLRQRQISRIKTDFINNMTHEFKTPIATINLALSAIKNPKTIIDKKKVKKYLKMIYDENNRMHDQVENVLMISHLEKNELNIEKSRHDLNDIINLAVSHLSLIVESKNGKISFDKQAENTQIVGNETHLINVFVNILDNAAKYNNNRPQILIKTKNINDKVIVDIEDNGIGMTKSVQSKIFDKFYRKQTGDVHDVKGHGLGLAYVKKIIDFHNGNINVESTLGKGSVFSIQLGLFK